MDTVEKFRRYMGIPVPYSMVFVVNVLGALWEWFMKHFSEPEVLRRELLKLKETFLDVDKTDRMDACDRIARKGRLILEMRTIHGKYAWNNVLAELRISRRTAGNYMSLYLFSATQGPLYERFRALGPTKLYRLARVAPEFLRAVTMDTPVPTHDGPVPLGKATDAQLASFLKVTFPAPQRSHADKVRKAATRVATLSLRWPEDEPRSPEALEAAAHATRSAANLLAAMTSEGGNAGPPPPRPPHRRQGPAAESAG